MPHPYPPHHPNLPYVGKHYYFLTFCTDGRSAEFSDAQTVDLVFSQFVRAGAQEHVELTAYCFMPDHVHLLAHGLDDRADCKAFISAAKQYSGYHFRERHQRRLWQRYGFDRVLRNDAEVAFVIGYIVMNPVRSGLVERPGDYPYLGSQCYTVGELLEMCSQLDPECFRLKPEATKP